MLLTGREALAAATVPSGEIPARLRFGSAGGLVESAQSALKKVEPNLIPDADFGGRTLRAVWAFQAQAQMTPDGIIGPQTAHMLGLKEWPTV
jgi:peptidoglycan hydrolase-like protein with peptidoglycan-binding domain